MGFSLCSTESIALELGTAIATRMRTREGTGLYQTAVFTMSSIPRHALEQILDPELLASNTEKTAEWAATTTTEVRKLVAPLIAKSEFFCAGATRALRTRSERYIRVVAHMIPEIKIRHKLSRAGLITIAPTSSSSMSS